MRRNVVERGFDLRLGKMRWPARPDHLAAEAEAAIDGADIRKLQEHAIGVAMHKPRHRLVRIVADRVGALFRHRLKLRRIGKELAGDRVVRIGGVDQLRHIRRNRNRVARGNALQVDEAVARRGTGFDNIGGPSKRSDKAHGEGTSSGIGVQITSSMRSAPVASITSRSRPSAAPLAGGMTASAARKSSSIG